jgi:hypothetical protein
MNFLVFWPFAFIISKKIHLHLFELIKDKTALKIWYSYVKVYDLFIWCSNELQPPYHYKKFQTLILLLIFQVDLLCHDVCTWSCPQPDICWHSWLVPVSSVEFPVPVAVLISLPTQQFRPYNLTMKVCHTRATAVWKKCPNSLKISSLKDATSVWHSFSIFSVKWLICINTIEGMTF